MDNMPSKGELYEKAVKEIESYIDWLKNENRPISDIQNACNNLIKFIQENCPYDFKEGDAVRDGQGGVEMRILKINGLEATCTLNTKGKQQKAVFNLNALIKSTGRGLHG